MRTRDVRRRQAWIFVTITAGMAVIGVAMSSPYVYRWITSWAPYSVEGSRAIGAQIVGSAVVAGLFGWVTLQIEARRAADSQTSSLRLQLAVTQTLVGLDLSGCSIENLDVANRTIRGGTFDGGEFPHLSARGTEFVDVTLRNTRLPKVDLRDAVLTRCDMTGSVMEHGQLDGLKGQELILDQANLEGTYCYRGDLAGLYGVDLVANKLIAPEVVLRDAVLSGADLSDSILTKAVMSRALLKGASFDRADLTGAILTGADLPVRPCAALAWSAPTCAGRTCETPTCGVRAGPTRSSTGRSSTVRSWTTPRDGRVSTCRTASGAAVSDYIDQVLAYFAAKADSYDDVVHQEFWQLSDQLLWDLVGWQVLDRVGPAPRLLDAGGGTGRWTERFLRAVPDGTATIYDLSAEMLGQARLRAAMPDLRGRVELEQGDLSRLVERYPRASFDVVFCFHNVLGFVPDPAGVLRQFADVLKVDGVLAMVVPNRHHMTFFNLSQGRIGDAERVARTGRGRFTPEMPEIDTFTPAELDAMVSAAGLTTTLLTGFPCVLYPGRAETDRHGSSESLADLLGDPDGFERILRIERELARKGRVAARGNNLFVAAVRSPPTDPQEDPR